MSSIAEFWPSAVSDRDRPVRHLICGIVAVIPEPDDQKGHRARCGSAGGRPVSYDKTAYKGRNVIEHGFNTIKHWRGLATRYVKHAVVFRGALVLAAALHWLTDPGDTP